MFLKSASFVSFTDKNFKCLTEIKILSVRMSDTKIQDILHRTRTCPTENYTVWHDASFCQTECLTSLKSFQEVCKNYWCAVVARNQQKIAYDREFFIVFLKWKWSWQRIKIFAAKIFKWLRGTSLYPELHQILRRGLARVKSLLHVPVNSLWLCILRLFFTSAEGQRIIFMFLLATKLA